MAATDALTGETPAPAARLAPVAPADRIFTLDMLRGFAILGILAVNAVAFAWPMELQTGADVAPPWPHDQANIFGHWVTEVFFHNKARSLFSMLFGVSIFLIGGERRDEARGALLWRRLLWLAVFGLIHGAAFWYGDILLHYAYTGVLVMLARSWSAKRLIWTGALLNLLFGLLSAAAFALQAFMPEGTAAAGGGPFAVTPESLAATIQAYQSGWPAALIENLKAEAILQAMSITLIPITGALMLLGMGLFKVGFLTGRSPTWVYVLMLLIGAANLAALGWYEWFKAAAPHGTPDPTRGMADVAASFAPLITLAYVSLLILMTRFGLKIVTGVLAPVGRMAFTNYLTQTLIMTTLFYMPWGPHWFGDPAWGPGQLWLAVGGVWITQLIWSPIWLSVFSMGPLEWLWRCLIYGRLVPIRKPAVA